MRYHYQCISAGNVLCGTTTNVFQLTLCHTLVMVPHITLPGEIHWLWYRIAHCQLKYTGCVTAWHIGRCKALVVVPHSTLPGESNVLCGTTTSVFHLAMCYAVPQSVYFTWQCDMRYHNQCISAGNVLCGTTTNVFQLTLCHMISQKYTGCGTT
jgi:hypothetical protein